MKKEYTLLALGIWVMAFPYLGFPFIWRAWILGVTGLCICLVAWRYWKNIKGPTEPITETLPKILPEIKNTEPIPTMADMPVSAPSPFIEHLKNRTEKVNTVAHASVAHHVVHTETVQPTYSENIEPVRTRAVRKPRTKIMGNDIA